MKKISTEQINGLLQAIYQINPPVQLFDAIKNTFEKLEEIKDLPVEEK